MTEAQNLSLALVGQSVPWIPSVALVAFLLVSLAMRSVRVKAQPTTPSR